VSDRIDEVTLVVKTFERRAALRRLVESIRARYPSVRIVVGDDSRRRRALAGVDYRRLPFDTGAAAGRNLLLERVETPYFVTLDDDFVFTEATRLEVMLDILASSPLDVLAGRVRNPGGSVLEFEGLLDLTDGVLTYIRKHREDLGRFRTYDIVPQFFAARTEAFRDFGGWDPELKLFEHTDLFLRAKGRLTVGSTKEVEVLHAPAGGAGYQSYRARGKGTFEAMFARKHGIRKINRFYGDVDVFGPAPAPSVDSGRYSRSLLVPS
jgi:glycosyltransferase involved in cell wall biosynthesis